jgi:C4-dicarboxylate-specific signal transduction histidine kinase
LQFAERVIVEDVLADPLFKPHLAIAAAAGFRALQCTPLFGRNGEPLGMISTHFRRPHRPSEHELRLTDLYARQAAETIERTRAEDTLHRTKDELARVTRVVTLGELASSIAHEVNQPLAAIVANSSAGTRWLATRPPNLDEANAALMRIVRDANRASEVVARIRAFVRRAESHRAALQVHDALQDVAALVRDAAVQHNVALEIVAQRDTPTVLADRVQLQQVLLNLAMNAIEAMRHAADHARVLQLAARPFSSESVLIAVRDSGSGLDPLARDRVFDAFYTTKAEGMGMGLAISRSIVEEHGGRLWATPNEGSPGETFLFTLPIAASSPAGFQHV